MDSLLAAGAIPEVAGDYLAFFFSQSKLSPVGLLTLFFLGLFRIAPIVSLAPFLGARLPGSVKMGLALSLTILFLPQLMQQAQGDLAFNLVFLGYALKELFIGFILGFLATIPFHIIQGSGTLIDFMRGSSSLQVQDPLMQAQTSPIGLLLNYVLIVIFFEMGGHFIFFQALYESFRILPSDQLISAHFFTPALPFWQMIAGLLTRITLISIQLGAPAIVAVLMAEMFLGIANRLAPQVQIAFLGMSLKSLLGLGLLWAGWFFILRQMGNQAIEWMKNIDLALRSFGM